MFKAHIFEDPGYFAQDWVRLVVVDISPKGVTYFGADTDSTTVFVAEGEGVPDNVGWIVQRGAVEAIAEAIADWQGHTSHADTEAKVLRESLEVERARVDRMIGELIKQ